MNFNIITEFEEKISNFFKSPYAIAVDSCTHGIELCLRHKSYNNVTIPCRTYISIPFTLQKLNLNWNWKEEDWCDYYFLGNTNIVDAAVLWKKESYIPGTFMNLSFQFQKHLSLGRGGMILLDNKEDYDVLKKMSYDGREHGIPWRDQNINTIGYHYYMTPETAQNGINKLEEAINKKPKKWIVTDWPDLRNMEIFK